MEAALLQSGRLDCCLKELKKYKNTCPKEKPCVLYLLGGFRTEGFRKHKTGSRRKYEWVFY